MLNKKVLMFFIGLIAVCPIGARADTDLDIDVEVEQMDSGDDIVVDAINNYQVEGSLFQQITDLEQEKVLMQLEKERAQLNLDLDRLAAEKIKLHLEIDALSGRAENQQQELETEKARLVAEAEKIERERTALEEAAANPAPVRTTSSVNTNTDDGDTSISDRYRLINVIGAGAQLQATLEDTNTGQTKRMRVGNSLDGYVIKSISLDDGVVFVKDGATQTLNISGSR